jgi:hypothetical protein
MIATIDASVSRDGGTLYVLTAAAGTVSAFRVNSDGTLAALPSSAGLPTSAAGLAVR